MVIKSSPPTTTRNNNNNNIMEEERVDEVKYRGVRKRKWGKWVSEIRLPNSRERIWLGSYDSPEKAARAFDAALFCLRGNTANFNFPHQPPNIPGATDLHPSQIQAIAATYANQPPPTFSSPSHHQEAEEVENHNHNDYELLQTPAGGASSSNFMNQQDHDDDGGPSFQLMDHSHIHSNEGVPDFGIFPGFDDYFMPMHPPLLTNDYNYGSEEQVFDSQDPSFQLWNF